MRRRSGLLVVGAVLAALLPLHSAAVAQQASRHPRPARISAANAKILASDDTAHVDDHGRLYFVDPAPKNVASAASTSPAAAAATTQAPLADTFTLHSRPDAARTLFLDFDGYTLPADSGWVTSSQNPMTPGPVNGFTLDQSDTSANFSDAEKTHIQQVWQVVTEKYAPFDVDVTTQDPGQAALNRSSSSDLSFGIHVVFTNDSAPHQQACNGQCAGIAYLSSFNTVDGSADRNVVWAFSSVTGGSPMMNAEVASHEVGHTLGLAHDGVTTTPGDNYSDGHANWIPIMGLADAQRAITQFSKGEYANANNTQDDLALIAANGAPLRLDDYGNTPATAVDLGAQASYSTDGVIATAGDQDVFKVTSACATTLSATASGIGAGGSLDIALSILNSSGTQVAVSDNAPSGQTFDNTLHNAVPTGLDADASVPSAAAGTYYLKIDGVGSGDKLDTGYSDYGSIGQYHLTISGCPVASGAVPAAPATFSATSVSHSSSATLNWTAPTSPGDGPVSGYQITGVPGGAVETNSATLGKSFTGFTPGTSYTVRVAARNAFGLSAPTSATVHIGTFAPLSAPAVSVAVTGTQADVKWAAPSTAAGQATLDGWVVEIYKAGVLKTTLTLPWPYVEFPFGGLADGSYEARVTGQYSADDPTAKTGVKPFTVGIPVATKPSAPRIGTAASGAAHGVRNATARWSAPTSTGGAVITSYRVIAYQVNASGKVIRTRTSSARSSRARSYTWGLPAGRYKFRVVAYNRVGRSPYSGYSRIVTSR